MFDLGIQELIVIFLVALLVLGPKKLPELGRTLGKFVREMKKALGEFKDQIDPNIADLHPDNFVKSFKEPFQNVINELPQGRGTTPINELPQGRGTTPINEAHKQGEPNEPDSVQSETPPS